MAKYLAVTCKRRMLRNYDLEKEILTQYLTKDKEEKKQNDPIIIGETYRKGKYQRKVATNDELVEKQYGLSKRQLDTLIQEMAQTYNFQWKVVSNALYKEHNIMISDRALNFRYYKLHPRNQKWGYSQEEAFELIKLFYVEGKRYKEINQRFGYRGEHSIRNTLYEYSSRGFNKLQYYLRDEILELPKETIIDKKKSRKAFLLQTLILNYGLKWDYNKHTLSLFYFFIVSAERQLQKVPKELAMMLYRRFVELIDDKKQQKKEMYEMIKPNLYEELELVKQERNRLCANKFRIMKTNERFRRDEEDLSYSKEQDDMYGSFIRAQKKEQGQPDEDYTLQSVDAEELRLFSEEELQLDHLNEESNLDSSMHLQMNLHDGSKEDAQE